MPYSIFIGFCNKYLFTIWIKSNFIKRFIFKFFFDVRYISIKCSFLFLTGGIFNPFAILLIVPTIVSSTFLSMGSTIILGTLTIILLFVLTFFNMPLPGMEEYVLSFPNYYVTGILISLIIGLYF